MSPKQVVICGYYGFANVGDEAILAGMLHDLRQKRRDLEFTVLSGDPQRTRELHQVESILWTDIPAIVEVVRGSDLVIVGGGGIFHDSHAFPLRVASLFTADHAGLSYYAGIVLLASLLEKPSFLYAVGVGPLAGEEAMNLTRMAFSQASGASVRDAGSLAELSRMGVQADALGQTIPIDPDPAFSLPLRESEQDRRTTGILQARSGLMLLGVSVRTLARPTAPDGWEGEVAAALDAFLERVPADVLMIPFQTLLRSQMENDLAAGERVLARMRFRERVRVAGLEGPPAVVAGQVASCDLFLGMRLHSLIFALRSGVPAVGLAYDPKVTGLLDAAGRSEFVLPPESWSAARIADRLQEAWGARHSMSSFVPEAAGSAGRAVALLEAGTRVPGPMPVPASAALQILVLRLEAEAERTRLVGDLAEREAQLTAEHQRMEALTLEVDRMRQTVSKLQDQLHLALEEASGLKSSLEEAQAALLEAEAQAMDRDRLARDLRAIHDSRFWSLMGPYWRLREGLRAVRRRLASSTHLRRLRTRVTARWGNPSPVLPPRQWSFDGPVEGKYDVFVLPIIDWSFRFQRPQHLSRQFAAAGHRVFYLRTTFEPNGEVWMNRVEERVFELQLPGDPRASIYLDAPRTSQIDLQVEAISNLAFEAGVRDALCLVHLPYWWPLAQELRRVHGWRIVYDCMDDHAGFDSNHKRMLGLETELIRGADLALATSKPLIEKLTAHGASPIHLPNAADLEHFADRRPEPTSGSGLVVGYVGAISSWFDFDLIRHAASSHPEWSHVLIGSTWGADPHDDLARAPNVSFLGEQPYSELPSQLSRMNVCCIPFKNLPLTRAADPVKLYEYLAAGKPVVANFAPEAESLRAWVRQADTPEAFTAAIEASLQDDSPGRAAARKEAVQQHSWSARFEVLERAVREAFGSVSVVLVTWNNLELTRACLQSLWESTSYNPFNLVVVDNNSTDGTPDYLTRLAKDRDELRIILNPENRGFAAAVNQGLAEATGDYVVILNNDVLLPSGWLGKLTAYLQREPGLGLVGPVTNSVGNEALVIPSYVDTRDFQGFANTMGRAHAGELAPIRMLAMFCAVAPRSVLDAVGPLEERFRVGMFEDDDYSIRVRQAGYRVACARDVYVHHHGSAGFDLLGRGRKHQLLQENRALFEHKWGVRWDGHRQGDLGQSAALSAELTSILAEEKDSLGVVILPHHRRGARRSDREALSLARRGYLTLLMDSRFSRPAFERLESRLYRCHVPVEVLDRIESPYLLGPGVDRDFALRLRAPRLVHTMAELEGETLPECLR